MFTIEEISGKSKYSHEIYRIENFCFGEDAWSEKTIRDSLSSNNYVFVVCCCNSEIVGYINASVVMDEAELNRVAVLKEYCRKGIGGLLADKLLDILKAKNISLVRLEVRASNRPAISLYKSKKFNQYATRKMYYNNPSEDAILMSLEI